MSVEIIMVLLYSAFQKQEYNHPATLNNDDAVKNKIERNEEYFNRHYGPYFDKSYGCVLYDVEKQ